MDTGAEQVKQVVEGIVEIQGMRVAVTGFKVGEAVEGAAEGAGHVHLLVVAEAVGDKGLGQHVHHTLHGSLQFRIAGTRVTVGGGVLTGVVPDHAAPCGAHCAHRIVAGKADCCVGEAAGDDLATLQAKGPDKGVITVDVAVEGGLAHTQLCGNPREGESLEPLGVDQSGCAVDNLCCIEGLASHGFTLALGALTAKLWSNNFS